MRFSAKLFSKLLLLTASLVTLTACEKTDREALDITEAEAVALITAAASNGTAGLGDHPIQIATGIVRSSLQCGYTKDSSFVVSNTNPPISWNYAHDWHWDISCTNNTPSALNVDFSIKGNFDAPKLAGKDTSTGGYVVTKLNGFPDSAYVVNGTYNRTGEYTSKIGNKNTYTAALIFTINNLNIRKINYTLLSGTANFSLNAVTLSGKTFSFSGKVELTGSNAATISFTGGKVYTVSW